MYKQPDMYDVEYYKTSEGVYVFDGEIHHENRLEIILDIYKRFGMKPTKTIQHSYIKAFRDLAEYLDDVEENKQVDTLKPNKGDATNVSDLGLEETFQKNISRCIQNLDEHGLDGVTLEMIIRRGRRIKSTSPSVAMHDYVESFYVGGDEALSILKNMNKQKQMDTLKPGVGDEHWNIEKDGMVCRRSELFHPSIDDVFDAGNLFKNEEAADDEAEKRRAIMRIKEYIANNFGVWEPDWEDGQEIKHEVAYCHSLIVGNDYFYVVRYDSHQYPLSIPYLEKAEHAEQLIKDCEDDLRIVFGVEGKE